MKIRKREVFLVKSHYSYEDEIGVRCSFHVNAMDVELKIVGLAALEPKILYVSETLWV